MRKDKEGDKGIHGLATDISEEGEGLFHNKEGDDNVRSKSRYKKLDWICVSFAQNKYPALTFTEYTEVFTTKYSMLDYFHETQPTYSYINICQVTVSEAAIFICGMQPRRRKPRKKNTIPKNNGPEQDNAFFCVCLPFQFFLSNTLPLRTCQSFKEKRKTLLFPLSTKAKRKRCLWRSLLPPPNFLAVEFQARSLNPSYRPGSLA